MEKLTNLVLLFIFATFIFSCTNCPPPQPLPISRFMIYLDKSVSVNGKDVVLGTMVEQDLKPLLDSLVRSPGDYVEVRPVHGESIGAKLLGQHVWHTNPPIKSELGPSSYKTALEDYELSLKKHRQAILQEVLDYLQDSPSGDVIYETDLLGTLEITSDFFKQNQPNDLKTVLYISDMVHSTKEPRDYHVLPIKDLKEAERCAHTDFVWLNTNRKVEAKSFENLNLYIWFTGGDYEHTKNEQMKYYWNTLFKELNPSIKTYIK